MQIKTDELSRKVSQLLPQSEAWLEWVTGFPHRLRNHMKKNQTPNPLRRIYCKFWPSFTNREQQLALTKFIWQIFDFQTNFSTMSNPHLPYLAKLWIIIIPISTVDVETSYIS